MTPLSSSSPPPAPLPPEIALRLAALGLLHAGAPPVAERLTGGVSSDIWKVTSGDRVFCVKRAMPKLAVEDDWFAPVERNRYERLWYEIAAGAVPGSAPAVLAHDDEEMFFAMDYLDPAAHRLWKAELAAGRADAAFAAQVGADLALIHRATAGDEAVAARFPTGAFFEALRLEPYLRATGRRHRDLNQALNDLADHTATTHKTLVHGDVSPKNILVGPQGPVFLDAECAWYGDPAFDLAFCLNHLLLKCLWVPGRALQFLAAFDALAAAYLGAVSWETGEALEARAAALLPALFLARVDGKSPVEYIRDDMGRNRVRRVAIPFVRSPPPTLSAIRDAWQHELAGPAP
jgi:aminoglycoside phosphotransferase (APT) family kinase protein